MERKAIKYTNPSHNFEFCKWLPQHWDTHRRGRELYSTDSKMSAHQGPSERSKILLYWLLFLYNLAPVSSVLLTSNTSAMLWENIDSVSLHCTAIDSVASYTWYLNGEPLPKDPRYNITMSDSPPYSSLIISPISRSDNGPFTCTAYYTLNQETSNAVTLNLAWYPRGNNVCTAELVGQNIQLGCSWPEGWPAANVTMNFNTETQTGPGQVFTNVSSTSTVQGSNLTCFGDQLGKTSVCTVMFEIPQSTGDNSSLVTIVTAGDTAIMTLNLTSYSLPAVFAWYQLNPNSDPVSITSRTTMESTNSSSSLEISDVEVEDAGHYECIAINIIGSQSFRFTLNVTEEGLNVAKRTSRHLFIILCEIAIFSILFGVAVVCVVKRSKGSPGEYDDNLSTICEKVIQTEQLKQKDKATYSTLTPSLR
ncbi:carcinoembryonic antigen-related cell adhesion molecule 1-like isoform X2 [Rana temporaria]|uniref:carcinoembryonic antigen-related cell adhesion molecule 1-like isoform X2 n=1 Tax=Rana temporaria TaxID=8407 RepID=UPI001AACF13A|nr:carcinoembryonic antigen-related cell adhesion molecule 1-like isoform X2 [Rana temporaria]